MASTLPLIGTDIAHQNGFSGAGQAVAILDTGVDNNHPFLAHQGSSKVIAEACFSSTGSSSGYATSTLCPNQSDFQIGPGAGLNCDTADITGCRHGTHVAGIAAGNGVGAVPGVAKDADIVSIQVFSRFQDRPDCTTNCFCGSAGAEAACVGAFSSDVIGGLDHVFEEQTNPDIPDVRLSLYAGFNMVSIPVILEPARNSLELAAELGPGARSIRRLDSTNQRMEVTRVVDGMPVGASFPILANEGLIIEMSDDRERLFSGAAVGTPIDLVEGVNLVGFHSIPEGMNAYQLLRSIGDASTIASIRRFNLDSGRYESVAWHNGQPIGINFRIRRGESYLLNMHHAVTGLTLQEEPPNAVKITCLTSLLESFRPNIGVHFTHLISECDSVYLSPILHGCFLSVFFTLRMGKLIPISITR